MIDPKFNFWSSAAGIVALISLTTSLFAQFAYVVNNGSQDVSGYKINANGSLTELPGSPFAAGNQPTSMAVNPAGTFAYVTNSAAGSVSEYKIAAGALVPNGTVFAGTLPTSVAVDRMGKFAYVANAGSASVSEYKINAAGVLTSNGSITVGSSPDSIATDPTRDFAFVVDKGTNTVYAFDIMTDGKLFPDNTKPVGSQSVFVTALSPSRPYPCLMTADKGSDQLSGYFLNGPMGQILSHRIRGFPLSIPPAGSQPQSLTVVKPDPRFRQYLAYIADNGTNKVSAYAVDGKCNFHDTIPGSPFKTGNGPTSLAIDPTIRFAYVVNEGDNNIWEYRIHGNGSLTKFGSQTLSGAAPVGIVIH